MKTMVNESKCFLLWWLLTRESEKERKSLLAWVHAPECLMLFLEEFLSAHHASDSGKVKDGFLETTTLLHLSPEAVGPALFARAVSTRMGIKEISSFQRRRKFRLSRRLETNDERRLAWRWRLAGKLSLWWKELFSRFSLLHRLSFLADLLLDILHTYLSTCDDRHGGNAALLNALRMYENNTSWRIFWLGWLQRKKWLALHNKW